jgi:thiol:disulfide interchange protein
MRLYKDPFFWMSGAKFTFALLIGLGLATIMLGISLNTALTMAVGGVLGFPAAFAFGAQRPRPTSGQITH